MAHLFAARSRVRGSKQPAAHAPKVLLNRHLLERPSPDRLPRHASHVIAAGTACWSPPQVRISGRGGHLPGTSKVDADLVPSAERAMAQAPSPTPPISSSVSGGLQAMSHLPALPSACPADGYKQSPAVNAGSLRLVLTWPFGIGARAALPRGSAFQARGMGHACRRWARSDQGHAGPGADTRGGTQQRQEPGERHHEVAGVPELGLPWRDRVLLQVQAE